MLRPHTRDSKTNGVGFTVNASMCGGGKHLRRHPTAVCVGNRTQRSPVRAGRIVTRGKWTKGLCPLVMIYCHGSYVTVASSLCLCPSCLANLPVRSLTSLSPAAILISVSCMVWTFERSADQDRHTAVVKPPSWAV